MRRLLFMVAASLLLLATLLGGATPALAQNPAPVQIFYVTLPEADALSVLDTINSDADSPIYTYFSIAIGVDGTYVYYDQWEDGYAADIANPTAAEIYNSASNLDGVQIWGNSLASDGCPPNKSGVAVTCTNDNDVLDAGDVIIPYNSVAVPNSSSSIEYDGKDKVGASASIAMARAAWASGSGTLNAFAHEMYATSEWGTAYEAPVGCNTANASVMFEYSALSIMAAQNNTPIRVDADGNGTWDYTGTLNEGGTYLEGYRSRTGCDYVRQGARVESTDPSKPIQVVLLTGDIDSNYESRDMNLLPVSAYGNSYWSPVGVNTGSGGYTPGPTRLFLYRPSTGTGGPTHITCARRSPTPTTVTQAVSVRGVVTVDLNDNSGAHCYASDSVGNASEWPIFAIGTVDTDTGTDTNGQAWDWSFTLFPDFFLSTDALVGLGLGRDPTSGTSTSENGSPLWVSPVCNTYVYVDWNNDGTADLVDVDGDGNATDTNNDGINETTSNNGMLITSLKSVRLFEPGADTEPYDQSGARVWSRTASGVGYGGTPGCNLALAWGQDPRRASPGAPGLDVGTSIPPLRLIEGTKTLTLKADNNSDGLLSPGDVATYLITIKNSGSVVVNNVYIYDTVPLNTTYVLNSTEKDVGSGWTSIPDDGSGTPFPLDDQTTPPPDGVLLGNLNAGATYYVRFDVTLGSGSDYEELNNCDVAYTGGGTLRSCATNFVASRDWGDLPDSYGTTRAADGPRHSSSGLELGNVFDYDAQGVPSSGADGDDTDLVSDDEDGVINSPLANWGAGTGGFRVTVAGGSGCLNAWMDYTNDTGSGVGPTFADGNFTKTGGYDTYSTYSEHIIQNVKLNTGTTDVTFSVPAGLLGNQSNSYYFRFRLSPTDGSGNCTTAIAPIGFVAGGEVEDYKFTFSPLAVQLAAFAAQATGDGVVLAWETVSEVDNVGFNVLRGLAVDGERTPLAFVPAANPGSTAGASYSYLDRAVITGQTYWYWLEDIDTTGAASLHGPVSATAVRPSVRPRVWLPLLVK